MRVFVGWIVVFLLFAVCAAAAPQTNTDGLSIVYPKSTAYQTGAQTTLTFQAYNASGTSLTNTTTNCTFTLYNANGSVNISGQLAYIDTWQTTLPASDRIGETAYLVECAQASGIGGFVSGTFRYTIDGTDEGAADLWPVAALVLVPLLFGFLCVAGAGIFDSEEHAVLKIFLFLLAMISPLSSLLFATEAIIKFYDWTAATDTISLYVYVLGGVLIALFFYWLMYTFYVMVSTIAEKKAKRLET